jgi:hypothetical protein
LLSDPNGLDTQTFKGVCFFSTNSKQWIILEVSPFTINIRQLLFGCPQVKDKCCFLGQLV